MAENLCQDTVPAGYRGDGSTTKYSFAFQYINTNDIVVLLWDETQNKYVQCTEVAHGSCTGSKTEYYFKSSEPVELYFCVAPGLPPTDRQDTFNNVWIARATDICNMLARFFPGTSIRAQDLNNDFTQILLALQDVDSKIIQYIEEYNGFVRIKGDVMEGGPLDMNDFQLTGVPTPTVDSDAANKKYVDDQDKAYDEANRDWSEARFVNVTGDTMTGQLAMSNKKIVNLASPEDSADAVNKQYVDGIFLSSGGDLDSLPVVRFIMTANGGETVLNPEAPVAPGNEIITVNGSTLTPSDDYTLTQDIITLRQPLLKGDQAMVLSYNSLKVVEVSSNFETYPFTRWVATATAGQTVFQGLGDGSVTLGYSPGYEQVTLNGSSLVRDVDYAANDKLSVILTQGAQEGDVLEVLCGNYLKTGDQESYAASDISYTYSDSLGGTPSNVQEGLNQALEYIGNGGDADGVLKVGTYYLWVDNDGRLRIYDRKPSSNTDGDVVGTQS